MKKKIAAIVVITFLAFAGIASANKGYGGGGYCGNCPYGQGQNFQQADPAIQEKLNQFQADTENLRKQIAVKQAERMALMRGDNPDPATAAKLASELFDLRAELKEKAEAAGVGQYLAPMGGGGRGGNMGWQRGGGGGRMGGGRF